MKRPKPLIAQAAEDLQRLPNQQYRILVAGRFAAITFTPAEEARVQKKADQRGVSIVDLIEQEILRRMSRSRRPVDEVIVATANALGRPSKKRAR